jgi:hypothetical protein
MINSNSNEDKSNEWFEKMVNNISNVQDTFISNMRRKVQEEQEQNRYNGLPEMDLDEEEKINEMLDNVDENMKQFRLKLAQEMDKVIKSHDIKRKVEED